MADNTTYTPGTGVTIAADEISSVLHQRVKVSLGADGSATDAVGGAGAVSAAVQRVTLASDDPAVAALQTLDNIVSGNEAQVDVVAALPAGDNNIGNVDLASAIPAGTNNIGDVDIATIDAANTKQLTNAAVDIASSGDNTIIAAVASQTTRVHVLVLIPASDVDIVLKSGSTALTGTLRLIANQPFALSFQGEPHFVTGTNEAFIVNLSAAVSVDGWVQYETSA